MGSMEELHTEERLSNLSAKEILRQHLMSEREHASQELQDATSRLTAVVDSCDERLQKLEGILGDPSLAVELRTWTTEYDIYTYSTVPGSDRTRDYQVNTDDIQKACELVVEAITKDKGLLYKAQHHDLALGRIGIMLAGEIVDLPLKQGTQVQKVWNEQIDQIPKR